MQQLCQLQTWQQSLSLGSYDDPAFAAMLYDAAALLLFEDFSSLNFPDIPTPPEVETILQARILRSPEILKFLRRAGRCIIRPVVSLRERRMEWACCCELIWVFTCVQMYLPGSP